MPDEKEIDPRRRYILAFRRHLRWCRDSNLSERVFIDTAHARTKQECQLSAEHQRDVDEFLKKEMMPKESGSAASGGALPFDFEAY